MMLTSQSLDAVVMASGINHIPLYADYQPGYKALLDFCGEPAIQYTLQALNGLPQIARIHIVGEEAALRETVARSPAHPRCRFVPGGATLMESLMQGLQSCQEAEQALLVTADLPLLTSGMVEEFLAGCAQARSAYRENFHVAVVPKRCFTGDHARIAKSFSRFRDVTVCPGNLALANPAILRNEAAMERINAVYAARKSIIGSALAFGMRVGLSYVVGVHLFPLLTLPQMAQVASRRFHFGVVPVEVEHPEVVIDVDEPEDYRFVQNLLAQRKQENAAPART